MNQEQKSKEDIAQKIDLMRVAELGDFSTLYDAMEEYAQSREQPWVRVELLKERIKERALIIYVLESALLDNEPKVPKPYKVCMKDEIDNHKAAIADYEEEIKKLNNAEL